MYVEYGQVSKICLLIYCTEQISKISCDEDKRWFFGKQFVYWNTLHARFFTDIMSRGITIKVIPEVISKKREERVMIFSQDKAVLSLHVVWFSISPVKPSHGCVPMGPPPVSWVILIVTSLLKHYRDKKVFTRLGSIKSQSKGSTR